MITDSYELLEELIELKGAETVLRDMANWLPSEKLDEIMKGLVIDYDLD